MALSLSGTPKILIVLFQAPLTDPVAHRAEGVKHGKLQ
jgi:hypothetical protein